MASIKMENVEDLEKDRSWKGIGENGTVVFGGGVEVVIWNNEVSGACWNFTGLLSM